MNCIGTLSYLARGCNVASDLRQTGLPEFPLVWSENQRLLCGRSQLENRCEVDVQL
jgi:hypothetical protein